MADQYLGTPVTAFLVLTLLTWTTVSVSGTTPELSTTIGDTVNITCLFGEGTSHILIKWYYDDITEHRMILKPVNGDLIIGAEYANRAMLHDDSSTLILQGITLADEGTYHCVVDTRKQTAPSNIETKLNVFSLRPDTLPVISPCIWADESSACSIHASQFFTLVCTLPNVYPVDDTKLIWYQDGQRVSFTDDFNTQNDDGTTDIIRQIKIYETGNFTCNATYNSATGKENTAVAVEAWIIPPTDLPNTPGKNLTSSLIAWKTICFVLFVVFSMAIALSLYFLKARGRRSFKRDEKEVEETLLAEGQRSSKNDELNQVTLTEERKPPLASAGNSSTDAIESSELTDRPTANPSENENAESSELTDRPTANPSENENVDSSASLQSLRLRNKNRIVSEKEFLNLSMLIAPSYYNEVGINLDISIAELGQIKEGSQNTSDALMTVFTRWRDKQLPGTDIRALLAEELKSSDLVFLSDGLLAGSLVLMPTDILPSTENFDDMLVAVAKKLRKPSDIDTLGNKLGFSPENIQGYIATNLKTQNLAWDGTLQMLRDWRKRQPMLTWRVDLKTALEESNQVNLADYLFPSNQ